MAACPGEIDRKVAEAARTLNLEPYLDRKPRQLSGGQRQRVAIGRAIVREPEGVSVRRAAVESRRRAARPDADRAGAPARSELNATMIYVTHDQVEAMTMADKIVVLQAAVIEQVGTPLSSITIRPTYSSRGVSSARRNDCPPLTGK
jgi:multiple sugar transport system ATP-binding protein